MSSIAMGSAKRSHSGDGSLQPWQMACSWALHLLWGVETSAEAGTHGEDCCGSITAAPGDMHWHLIIMLLLAWRCLAHLPASWWWQIFLFDFHTAD